MDFFPAAERMEGFKILWEEWDGKNGIYKSLENPGASLWILILCGFHP
jgi:hypothetical protein